jgi:phosphopentomutase
VPQAESPAPFDRAVIIVLDGVGIGALPDAAVYADEGAATLQHVAAAVGGLQLPTLESLGLGRIAAIQGVAATDEPRACWGKMAEASAGKDSVTGHWELAGLVLEQPFHAYPEGFPEEIIALFAAAAGARPLGNCRDSGTDILCRLGEEHLRSGRPIVYTSVDSVFQVAVHEEVMPPEQLYHLCGQTLEILRPYNVCRVIARPFLGGRADTFYRTHRRRDFSREPHAETLLSLLQAAGIETCGVGKIKDLYAGVGLSRTIATRGNRDGMEQTLKMLAEVKSGLIMTNLVDFDMLYGHRRDCRGFADALAEFDRWLPTLLESLSPRDLLIITADHGCDPVTAGTDHTREYVPLLAYTKALSLGTDLGVRATFADVAATIADIFSIRIAAGKSFLWRLPVFDTLGSLR